MGGYFRLLFCLEFLLSVFVVNVSAGATYFLRINRDRNRWEGMGSSAVSGCDVWEGKKLKCFSANIPFIPYDIEELKLDNWKFDSIEGDLSQLKHLKTLRWMNSRIKTLPLLQNMPNLQTVNYDSVSLDNPVVNEGAFVNLTNLFEIRIQKTNVKQIEKNAFVNLAAANGRKHFHYLTLSDNEIESLRPESFVDVSVGNLFVENNKIHEIKTNFFQGFKHLGQMAVFSNNLPKGRKILFDPHPEGFTQFLKDGKDEWGFTVLEMCGKVAATGCQCVEDYSVIDCTSKGPGFNPLKKVPFAERSLQTKFVRHDVTDLLRGSQSASSKYDSLAAKKAAILDWCYVSFPEEKRLKEFRRASIKDLTTEEEKMVVDVKDLKNLASTFTMRVSTFLLTSTQDSAVLPPDVFLHLSAAKSAFKGKIYSEIKLYMFDDEDKKVKCEAGVAPGFCKIQLHYLTVETPCPSFCPTLTPPPASREKSEFTPSFLLKMLFCGKKSNAERKNAELEKELMIYVEKVGSGENVGMNDIAATAGAMAGLVDQSYSSIHPVPYLSGVVWRRLTESMEKRLRSAVVTQTALAAAISGVEGRIFDRNAAVKDRKDDMNAVIAKTESALANAHDVIEIRKSDFEDAQFEVEKTSEAQKKLYARFKKAKRILNSAMREFKHGCEVYQAMKLAEAALSIATSIFGIFTGRLEFNAATKAVEKISKVLSIVRDMKDIVQTLVQVSATIQSVMAFIDTVHSIPKEVPTNFGEYNAYKKKMELADKVSDLSVSIVEWKNLRNFADAVFGAGEIVEIGGASNVRRAIADLSNWGEAVTKEAIAQAKIVKEMNAMSRKRQLAEKQKARAEKELDLLKNKQIIASTNDDYKRQLDAKIASTMAYALDARLQEIHLRLLLFDALDHYCNTYFYSKFEECPKSYKPTLSLSPEELMSHIHLIYETGWKALAKFNPAPHHLDALDVIVEDDPKVCSGEKWNYEKCPIKSLQDTKSFQVSFHPQDRSFRNYNRFRVTKIQVFLEGAKTTETMDHIYVKIATSGLFNDTFNGKNFQFVSVPLNLAFEYLPATKHVTIDGSINDEDRENYYQTTPFTDWIISLPKEANTGLKIRKLKKVKIIFSGSVVPKYYILGRHRQIGHNL